MSNVIQRIQRLISSCLSVLAMLIAISMLVSLIVPFISITKGKDERHKGISNCRQIITAMRIYASDHDGKYPDAALASPRSSNDVFRGLFQSDVIDNELIFGCPPSPFVPDGNIGQAPDFKQAIEAGENHWAMTPGVSDSDSGSIPLVYENPVVAIWSPKWNADVRETKARGRAWMLNRGSHSGIIIGMNDSSVGIQPLASKTGTAVPLKDLGDGENLFSQYNDKAPAGGWVILDVEVKP